ncbi:MAG: DUF4428 domain-containing protein [Eubacterium sp.]|nr:DUF4428 domain-containing protein [Eubacterium sp.]
MGKCSICEGKTGILQEWPLKDGQFCKKCNKQFQEAGFRFLTNWHSMDYTVQEARAMLASPKDWQETVNARHRQRELEKEKQAQLKEANKNCFLCGKRIMFRYMTSDNRALCMGCVNATRTTAQEELWEKGKKFDPFQYVEEHSSGFFLEHMAEMEHPHPALFVNYTKRNFYSMGDPGSVFTFESVIKFESDIHTYEVTEGKRGHPIARAVAGGILFGPVGAVIGASTSKDTRHKETVEGNRYINIYYKDPSQKSGVQKASFYTDDDTVIVRIEECFTRAFEIRDKQAETGIRLSETQDALKKETTDFSQLIELKELFDMGILTQEEFEQKKKNILKL